MTDTIPLGTFDFTFEASLDTLDDYERIDEVPDQEGLFLPNVEGRTEFMAPDPSKVPVIANAVKQDEPEYAQRSAEDRTHELFGQMRPQRAVLLGIIDAAHEPLAMDEVTACIKELRERKFSVYTASNLCVMLEVAGALERVTEEGSLYDACEPKPDVVVIDGEEYYEPVFPPKVYWLATQAGLAVINESDPIKRVTRLFDRESDLLAVFKHVLVLACAEEGVSVADLSTAVDRDPLVCEPRRFYVQHFIEALERCDALVWQGSAWKTTQTGLQALEILADVADDYRAPTTQVKDNGSTSVPTETVGINW